MMHHASIHPLQPSDYSTFCSLMTELDGWHHDAMPNHIRPPDQCRIPIAEYTALLTDSSRQLLGITQQNRIVGFVHVCRITRAEGRVQYARSFAQIEQIIVTKNATRAGLGHALVDAAREWATQQQLLTLELSVYAINADAARFYERVGFNVRSLNYALPIDASN